MKRPTEKLADYADLRLGKMLPPAPLQIGPWLLAALIGAAVLLVATSLPGAVADALMNAEIQRGM